MTGLLITSVASTMYNRLNENIEKMSEILYLFAIKLTAPSAMVPALIVFAIDYATDNVSDESYYLPFPVM